MTPGPSVARSVGGRRSRPKIDSIDIYCASRLKNIFVLTLAMHDVPKTSMKQRLIMWLTSRDCVSSPASPRYFC